MKEEPFIISKRKESPYYQVRFKNPDKTSSVRFLPARSTKEPLYSKAVEKAWMMYENAEDKKQSIISSIKAENLTNDDIQKLTSLLKETGVIANVILPTDRCAIKLADFLSSFWTEKSDYVKERKRCGGHIGLSYITECNRMIQQFWIGFVGDKLLGEFTRSDLKDFINYLDNFSIGWSRKLKVYRAGATALKWAYNEEMISRDITAGIQSFSGKSEERNILTVETAELLLSIPWKDRRAELINLIAMLTGMRCGEILALRKCDLGNDCIYVRHSWNRREGLKSTKNGETRTVLFPFPKIIEMLLYEVSQNPLGDKMESFIFYAELTPEHPLDVKLPNRELKYQLKKIGVNPDDYCFHSWRHFYTSCMFDSVNERALMSQTGHKTRSMVEHYGMHGMSHDRVQIQSAQLRIFGKIAEEAGMRIY